MRTLTAFAALLMLVGIIQDKPFTFKKDSVMTYTDARFAADGTTTKTDMVWTVSGIDGDKISIDVKGGNTIKTDKFVLQYSDGYFCWGTDTETGLRVFKLGAKVGDKWSPVDGAPEEVMMSYAGEVDVTTPAGKFKCKKMVIDANGHVRVTFFFADKVGLVKGQKEFSLDGEAFTTNATIELQKFVEGK